MKLVRTERDYWKGLAVKWLAKEQAKVGSNYIDAATVLMLTNFAMEVVAGEPEERRDQVRHRALPL